MKKKKKKMEVPEFHAPAGWSSNTVWLSSLKTGTHDCAMHVLHRSCVVCPWRVVKLIFYEHTTNHSWLNTSENIIFIAEIRCAARKHEFKHKNTSKLWTIFPLYLCKNRQNLVCHVQFQQRRGICSQFRPDTHFKKICS